MVFRTRALLLNPEGHAQGRPRAGPVESNGGAALPAEKCSRESVCQSYFISREIPALRHYSFLTIQTCNTALFFLSI